MSEITTAKSASAELRKLANPQKAILHQRFFKTGKGDYAEGDSFLGLTVPQIRTLEKRCRALPLKEMETLLQSKFHEERLLALCLMVENYRRAEDRVKKQIFNATCACAAS